MERPDTHTTASDGPRRSVWPEVFVCNPAQGNAYRPYIHIYVFSLFSCHYSRGIAALLLGQDCPGYLRSPAFQAEL